MYHEMDLCGSWEALPVNRFDGKYDSNSGWTTTNVPGHWQQTPELSGHTGKVVYKKRFKYLPGPGKQLFIRFGGVFYWFTAYLNGVRLGANEGYFFPTDFEVTGLLEKENELLVEADCPPEDVKTEKRQITGVFHHPNYGGNEVNPGGLWLPVTILSSGPVRIVGPFFSTAYIQNDGSRARVLGEFTIGSEKELDLEIDISFIPKTFSGEAQTFKREVYISPGERTYQYNLDLVNPVLWWTHDHGRPELYSLQITATPRGEGPSDSWETAFGVRTIEKRNHVFYLNGKKIYIRGSNHPPPDLYIANVNKGLVEQDLDMAVNCNINMLRVHGHVSHPALYEACDEKGMLLWQDFPLKWNYHKDVLPQALRQAEKMVRHLGNHPSIALWCMHNQPFKMYDTAKKPGVLDLGNLYFSKYIRSHNREVIDPKLAEHVRYLDPHRPSTASSGEKGWRRKADDTHLFWKWTGRDLKRIDRIYKKRPSLFGFISEFGTSPLPLSENFTKMGGDCGPKPAFGLMSGPGLCRNLLVKSRLLPVEKPAPEELDQKRDEYLSFFNRYIIDRARALKYKPGGGFLGPFFISPVPHDRSSVADRNRGPRPAYYELQKYFSPLYSFIVLEETSYKRNRTISFPLYAVNDSRESVAGLVRLTVTSPTGEEIISREYCRTFEPDSMATALDVVEVRLRWEGIYQVAVTLEAEKCRLHNAYEIAVI